MVMDWGEERGGYDHCGAGVGRGRRSLHSDVGLDGGSARSYLPFRGLQVGTRFVRLTTLISTIWFLVVVVVVAAAYVGSMTSDP